MKDFHQERYLNALYKSRLDARSMMSRTELRSRSMALHYKGALQTERVRQRFSSRQVNDPSWTHIFRERLRPQPEDPVAPLPTLEPATGPVLVLPLPEGERNLSRRSSQLSHYRAWLRSLFQRRNGRSALPSWVPPLSEEICRYLIDSRQTWAGHPPQAWQTRFKVEFRTVAFLLDFYWGCLIARCH